MEGRGDRRRCCGDAIDGAAVAPFALKTWLLGPPCGSTLSCARPAEGAAATLVDQRETSPSRSRTSSDPAAASQPVPFDPQPLRARPHPEPDLASAERLTFTFAPAGSDGAAIAVSDTAGGLQLGPICTASDSFWTINGRAWPPRSQGDTAASRQARPFGRSYVFELQERTQLLHPIHIPATPQDAAVRSSQPPVHHCRYALLTARRDDPSRVRRRHPGRWMFHCTSSSTRRRA